MASFLFVRHAESEDNAEGRISTSVPGPKLSKLGLQQAERLAERLADRPISAVFSSPAQRAMQTAELVARAHGQEVIADSDLVELWAGELEGMPVGEGLPRLDAGWAHWMNDGAFDEPVAAGGEIANDVIARMRRFVSNTHARLPGDQLVVVVAHGGILQLTIPALCSNLPHDFGWRNWLRNVQTAEVVGEGLELRCVDWAGGPAVPTTPVPSTG
jgi:broad specificity phosphatase PhoE